MRDLFKSLFLALTAGVLFGFTACVTDAGGKKEEGVTSVTLTATNNAKVKVGETITLTATPNATPAKAEYIWTTSSVAMGQINGSSDSPVTTAENTVSLKGIKEGTVTVTVTVDGVKSNTLTVTVEPGESSGGSSGGDEEVTVFWNASDYAAQDITSETTLGIMTVEASSSKKVTISSASATIDEVNFTNKLALGGSGSVGNYRTLKFSLTDSAAITVYAGKAGGTGRNLVLNDGSTTYGSQEISNTDNSTYTYTYTGSGATLYLYSSSSGIDIYGVKIVTGSLSVSSVTISGKTSVEEGSSITLTAATDVSTTSAYTWTVTNGTGSATGSSTTNTLTLTGVTAGTVTVTATVDGVTSAAYTVTVKEAGTSPTISLADTPTGYAGYGSPSYYAGSSTITINASDANAASTLKTYAKKGNYVIYINGMIDMTYNSTYGGSMLPTAWNKENTALNAFIAAQYNSTTMTDVDSAITSWADWRQKYGAFCTTSTEYNSSTAKSATTLDRYQYELYTAWKKQIQIVLASNTTIIGLTDESGIKGGTISIYGSTEDGKISNIMLRNLHLQDAFDPFPHHESGDGWNAEYDCITIQGYTDYIWIDHCTFEDTVSIGWTNFAGVKTGYDVAAQAYSTSNSDYEMWQTYDGLCDIKGVAQNITVSYCVFQNHDKTMLIGSSDSETTQQTSSVKHTNVYTDRTITLHHNKFYGCVQRLPMARLSYIHNFNNYYGVPSKSNGYDQKAAVNARYGVYINSEYNYFDSGLKTSYNSSDSTAYLYYANDTGAKAGSTSLSSLTTSTTTPVFTVPYEYSSILDSAADLPSLLSANAGAGVWSVEE